jgi:hypothetical protein
MPPLIHPALRLTAEACDGCEGLFETSGLSKVIPCEEEEGKNPGEGADDDGEPPMKRKKMKERKRVETPSFQYIFFDFETVQERVDGREEMVHRVNLACSEIVCSFCYRQDILDEECKFCKTRQMTFYGEEAVDEFCKYLFKERKWAVYGYAHNLQVSFPYLRRE